MKTRVITWMLVLWAVVSASAQHVSPAIPYDAGIERQVEEILARLSLDEKIGQMCELTIDAITDTKVKNEFRLSEEALDNAFKRYKVGSILNTPKGYAQTPEVWSTLIRRLNTISAEQCNGVPQLYGVDQIHGASYTMGATLFPQGIGQAASFNTQIPLRVGQIAAYESRAGLIPWVYSPTMDLGRQPMWSRQWESYGEDVLVTSEMAAHLMRGYQGDDPNHIGPQNVAACLKHYMAYGVPVNGQDRTPSSITEREMREKFFEPFRRCIREGALSIMVNSGVNNGIPFHANHELLTVWLKEQLNWDGMIVTDWADINNLHTRDHIAATKKEAIEIAINAGIDMAMEPYNTDFCDLLKESVMEGRVKMSRIDDAVRRILRLKCRLGLMEKETWDLSPKSLKKQFPQFASDDFAAEAAAMAEECMVLLKNNENILPLKQGTNILVCGPNANNFRPMNGGWSYSWQGDRADEACRSIGKYKTFYEALRDKFGADHVTLKEGVRYAGRRYYSESVGNIDEVVEAAKSADVVIAFVGENSYCETPGNLTDLAISANQEALVQAVAATGKPIVLVLNEGRPRLITGMDKVATAVVHTFLPSNYGGVALARLLSGEANFSGKMPYSYPRHPHAIVTYDYKPCESTGTMAGNYNYDAKAEVLYPFGFGLSYTTFEYSDLKAERNEFTAGDSLAFTVDVKNTGAVAGKEPVLLYAADLVASVTPDIRRLRAFTKVSLEPGETKTVTFRIAASDLAFVGHDNRWRLEQGDFRIMSGKERITIRCTDTFVWTTPNRN